jgi:hypothetical protein
LTSADRSRTVPPEMPKVTFVNEHRTVDCEPGRLLSKVAQELGVAVCRESFAGTGLGDYTVWVQGEPGSLSPPTFLEKLAGIRGTKRMANRARVLGDVMVWTQPGLADRLRSPRPLSPTPRPSEDATAPRLGVSAAGSAAFPYGNPLVVGRGERQAIARNTGKAKGAKGAAAADEADEADDADEEAAD